MLHLISQAPFELAILERIAPDDVALFIDNAVLGLLENGKFAKELSEKCTGLRICVLHEDMKIRGIKTEELASGLEVINYSQFVELTVENSLIQSWC